MAAISRPNFYTKAVDTTFNAVSSFGTKLQKTYEQGERRLIKILDALVPERLHYVSHKIAKTIPEIIVSATVISGSTRAAATLYGVISLAWATAPMARQALKGNFTNEAMKKAARDTVERFKNVVERFRPAVFIAFAASGVACTALGIANFNPGLVTTGIFLGIISYIALESIQAPKPKAAAAP